MPDYKYIGHNSTGTKETGNITADNKTAAVKKLRDLGLVISDLSESGSMKTSQTGKAFKIPFIGGISGKDRIILTQQLSIMAKSGLPISQALHSLAEETTNKSLVKVVNKIAQDVEGGTSMSQAFAKHPEVFNSVYISILKAGEKSGKVDEVLMRLATQEEKDYDIKNKVKGALAYPIFVLVAMAVIVTLIMVFIVPQIQAVFDENSLQLPLMTKAIIAISMLIRHQFIFIIIGVIALFVGYKMYYRSEKGHYQIDLLKINMPVFGALNRKVSIARFARIFSTLLTSGLPMLEIFSTAQGVMGNEVFRREIDKAGKDIENGLEISLALKKQPHIPKMMIQLTAVGEKSGNIDVIYENLANFMEKEVENITRNLTTLLEPALMLIMGAVIGSIVIAVLLPIYSMSSSI